jgi:hypothetical protein
MDWQELKRNFAMATVKPGASVDQAMIEFCEHIKARVIPMNDGLDWDYLRVEFWSDSGRMIVFPSSSSGSDRIEKSGCQVVFSDLLSEYERLADSNLDDEAFTAALLSEEKLWIDRFLGAARTVSLSGNHIQFWDGDGEQPICDEQI